VQLKKQFNRLFIIKNKNKYFAAQALDGAKNPIKTITGNPLLLLWASYKKADKTESILNDRFVNDFVERGFMADLFDAEAGIRTMSSTSPTFNPNQDSYHNGSFWPVLNGMIHEGLVNFNYHQKARALKEASTKPIEYFGTPLELYTKSPEGKYLAYQEPNGGQSVCLVQAWSAASMLDMLTGELLFYRFFRPLTAVGKLPLRYIRL